MVSFEGTKKFYYLSLQEKLLNLPQIIANLDESPQYSWTVKNFGKMNFVFHSPNPLTKKNKNKNVANSLSVHWWVKCSWIYTLEETSS